MRSKAKSLEIVPITLRKANDFVASFHRHNGRTARNGGKWAIGIRDECGFWGVAIVGNPLSATLMDGWTAEVLRVCVKDGSPLGTCSKLYARCWQIWRLMGGRRLVTYTLQSESGGSLRGAGWKIVGECKPTEKGWRKNDHLERKWQSVMGQKKFRWEVQLSDHHPSLSRGPP
jgi:hypothetical protein